MKFTERQVKDLAIKFSDALREQLGPANFAEMVARNLAEDGSSDVCHSHDFCDANQVMFDCAEELTLSDSSPEGRYDDDQFAVMGKAWTLARVSCFLRVEIEIARDFNFDDCAR